VNKNFQKSVIEIMVYWRFIIISLFL